MSGHRFIMRVSAAIALSVFLFLAFGLPHKALAHAGYVRSEPAFGATLREAPQRVTIWFSQELDKGSQIRVIDQRGQRVDEGPTEVSMSDPKSMSVRLKPLSTGAYLVQWESLSLQDKEAAEGSFVFSVGSLVGAASENGRPEAAVSVVVAAIALLVGILALLRTRRRGV